MIFRTNKSDYSDGIKCFKVALLICLEKEVFAVYASKTRKEHFQVPAKTVKGT